MEGLVGYARQGRSPGRVTVEFPAEAPAQRCDGDLPDSENLAWRITALGGLISPDSYSREHNSPGEGRPEGEIKAIFSESKQNESSEKSGVRGFGTRPLVCSKVLSAGEAHGTVEFRI